MREREGRRVRRRPERSPMFQARKARGMKRVGGKVLGLREGMMVVKIGKSIVSAKVRKRAVEREGSLRKRAVRGMDLRDIGSGIGGGEG